MEKQELETLSDDQILDYASELSDRYLRALSEVGVSTATHIYELDLRYLPKSKEEQSSFLLKMKKHYLSLGIIDRIVFMNEVLEPSRVYPFWYLEYFSTRNFKQTKVNACKRALAAL